MPITLEKLSQVDLVLIVIMILPGFISIQVYRLLKPLDRIPLKDQLIEAVAYSVLNLAFGWLPVNYLAKTGNELYLWLGVILLFVIFPAVWPVAIGRVLRRLVRRGAILDLGRNGWDFFFEKRAPCWLIIHLKDGRRIGGYFGTKSFASLHPTSGHLYMEELWELKSETGDFLNQIPGTAGIILRPDDYAFIELKREVTHGGDEQ